MKNLVGAGMKRLVDDGMKKPVVEEVPTALPQPYQLVESPAPLSESRSSASPIVHKLFKHFRAPSSEQDHASTPRSRRSLESQTRPMIDNRESPHVAEIRKINAALEEERAFSAELKANLDELTNLNSCLAKENTTLKIQLQIEDERTLLNGLGQLNHHIRSWCFNFYNNTSNSRPKASLPQLPHHSEKVSYSPVHKDSMLLAYGLAAVWELLFDCVFECQDGQGTRDLWTTHNNAQALKHLENVFVASLGKAPDLQPCGISDSSPR